MTWLGEGECCALEVDHGDVASLLSMARAEVDCEPVDVCVRPGTGRALRQKLLIADMDSTMIEQECIDELAAEAGLKDHVSAITAKAMNGELDFDAALRERVGLLRGLPVTVIDKVVSSRITLMPGGRELVATMKTHGAWCALVSGGFTEFTSRIAAMIGFHEHQANILEHANGFLTGTVKSPILGREAKRAALHAICERLGIAPADALAVGDGANDLAMIGDAGVGVALHAKPVVAQQARHHIDHGDLTALLYIQGYHRNEFVQ